MIVSSSILDLRIGCAFTRFQTKFFHEKYGDLDSSLISFGPCQTPTLAFCVERHDKIQGFEPVPYWVVTPTVQSCSNAASPSFSLSWDREREFEFKQAQAYFNKVKGVPKAKVSNVARKEKKRPQPNALNTVELLRVCSSSLSIGPHQTMQIAERLYTQGYISYPRTETTTFSDNFDVKETLRMLQNSREWGKQAYEVLERGPVRNRGGKDCGDHPPIHPTRNAEPHEFGDRDAWRIFEYVCRHFVATFSGDLKYEQTTVTFKIGDEKFSKVGSTPLDPGFTAVMPWLAIPPEDRIPPNIRVDDEFFVQDVKLNEKKTSPPDYLSEADLISLMEKHGIGTDASIPTHINNICQRNYVKVAPNRKLIPTRLGIVLVHGYQKIDPALALPTSRAALEKELNQIASGRLEFKVVLNAALDDFRKKFLFFRENIQAMDELFQVSFSSLADSGKPISKCGNCRRFMKLIMAKPVRLYCPTCNQTLNLPFNGTFRPHKELRCPHDNFDLLYFNGGVSGKSFVLCPLCYNIPPFEDMPKASGCNGCTNRECDQSVSQNGIAGCRECRNEGVLMPDQGSGPPKWRIRCNQCLFMFEGFDEAIRINVDPESKCNGCNSRLVSVAFKREGGERILKGCIFCTPELSSQLQVRVGARFIQANNKPQRRTGEDNSNSDPPNTAVAKPNQPQKSQKVPAYNAANDPNAEERIPVHMGGRRGGRGGRGRGRGGRGRGGRGRGRGGHHDGGDRDEGYGHPSRTGLTLSDFLK